MTFAPPRPSTPFPSKLRTGKTSSSSSPNSKISRSATPTPSPDNTSPCPLSDELNNRFRSLLCTPGPTRSAALLAARNDSANRVRIHRSPLIRPEQPSTTSEGETAQQQPTSPQTPAASSKKRVSFSKANLLDNHKELRSLEREKSLGYETVGKQRLEEVRRDLLGGALERFGEAW